MASSQHALGVIENKMNVVNHSCKHSTVDSLTPAVRFSESKLDDKGLESQKDLQNHSSENNSLIQYACSMKQPEWIIRPGSIPGCPTGLEYLTQVDQILVHQVVELLEAFTGWETKNRYVLKNSVGQQVFYAMEESDLCMRQCCGPARAFIIHITDNLGQEVMLIKRQFKCCAGCCWFAVANQCSYEVTVEAPPGEVIAFVTQQCSPWSPKFSIHRAEPAVLKCNTSDEADGGLVVQTQQPSCDKTTAVNKDRKGIIGPQYSDHASQSSVCSRDYIRGEPQLFIRGPICVCQGAWCCEQDFSVLAGNGKEEIGKITKQFSGLIKEYFTDADNFGVQFPIDLEVKMKAAMIGAVFLIDFMYFENENNRNS